MDTKKLTDPLVEAASPDRPNYELGVMLDKDDFVAEQTYHRGRLARALQLLHGAGSVAGLEVTHVPAVAPTPASPDGRAEEISVGAGVAIDGVGRLIEVPRAACITLQRWWDAQTNDALTGAFKATRGGVVADVFLRFMPCARGRTPAFAAGAFDALDATVSSRLRDGYELRLFPRSEDAPAVPDDPWKDVSGANGGARLDSAKKLTFGMWQKLVVDRPDRTVTPKLLDPKLDWLLLARCVIAAEMPAGAPRPTRKNTPPTIDNMVRSFALAAGALLRVAGV